MGGAVSGSFSLLRKPVTGAQLADRVATLLEAMTPPLSSSEQLSVFTARLRAVLPRSPALPTTWVEPAGQLLMQLPTL